MAKKLLKQALEHRLRVGTIVPGTLLVLQHDDSIKPDEAQELANMLHSAAPCTQVLLLSEHIWVADVQHPGTVQQ